MASDPTAAAIIPHDPPSFLLSSRNQLTGEVCEDSDLEEYDASTAEGHTNGPIVEVNRLGCLKLGEMLSNRADPKALADRNILKDPGMAPNLIAAKESLERKQKQQVLEAKLGRRPSKVDLVQKHIIEEGVSEMAEDDAGVDTDDVVTPLCALDDINENSTKTTPRGGGRKDSLVVSVNRLGILTLEDKIQSRSKKKSLQERNILPNVSGGIAATAMELEKQQKKDHLEHFLEKKISNSDLLADVGADVGGGQSNGETEAGERRGSVRRASVRRSSVRRTSIQERRPSRRASFVPPAITAQDAWKNLQSDDPTDWVVVSVSSGKPCITAHGSGGINDMKAHLDEAQALYGVLRVTAMDTRGGVTSTRAKYVLVMWTGEKVPPVARARASTLKGDVENVFCGTHVTLQVSTLADLETEAICSSLLLAGGAHTPSSFDLGGGVVWDTVKS